jgi:hypothetical protein
VDCQAFSVLGGFKRFGGTTDLVVEAIRSPETSLA